MKRTRAALLTAVLGAALLGGHIGAQVLPPAPPSLKTVPVPEPTNLALFVRNNTAAIALGKAFFWDMQVGSDGIQACASCHFHAGADDRTKNQLNPGTAHAATTFEVAPPNHTLVPSDFPLHRLADPASRFSSVLFDSDDVVSSQGMFRTKFVDIVPGRAQEMCSSVPDPIWNVGGTNVRRVASRNAPTVINAIFNFRNLWNGRGNAVFNGVSTFGARDAAARVLEVQLDGSVVPVPIAIDHGSVASVAVGPPVSSDLMSCAGRTWPKIGKKLLGLTPLGRQLVDPRDSVLGTLANSANTPGAPGLQVSYATLIRDAFQPQWWNSTKVVSFPAGGLTISDPTGAPLTTDQFTVMEANFPLFFGLAVQLYQATLVSDDSPFDRFMDGGGEGGANTNALTPQQKLGLAVFTNVGLNPTVGAGGCIACHAGAEFTVASTSRLGLVEPPDVLAPPPMAEGVIEQMAMALQGALRGLVFATNPAALEPGTLPLDFDPRGAVIEIRQGTAPDAPVAFSGALPGVPGTCGAALIPLVLTPNRALALGPLPFATAALTVAPDCTALFEVAIRTAPTGDYPVLVGGIPRGVITVVPDAFYDAGFYNTGARPTADDLGLGDEAPVGVPLAFARRIQLGLLTPEIVGLPGANLVIGPTDTIAADGTFKTPTLRNVELTAPYFHNGGMATLQQVLDFYNRGGDFHELNIQNLDAVIVMLNLTAEERAAVVAFLLALTDNRVRFEMAPFDHPQLLVPDGHPGDETGVTDNGTGAATDALLDVSAVGAVGACVGVDGTPRVCDDHNVCTADSCQPGVGCMNVPNPPCDDGNPCTDDSCDPVRGCVQTNNTAACDDGSACTTADTCAGGSCVGGPPPDCNDGNSCTADGCDPASGCTHTTLADLTACEDGNLCTQSGACLGGTCIGSNPIVCTAQDQCHVIGVCDPASGVCSNPAASDGVSCNDGNACTQSDTCQAGACTGSNPVVCAPPDQCHEAGVCDPATGTCTFAPKVDGTSCTDGNACTQTDTCQAGVCTGANPVVCSALDQCHVAGTCDPASGTCSTPNKADGTTCTDGNACTQSDTCQAGTCTGANPVVCTALDQCHVAGVCDPASGSCSTPTKSNGSACTDGDACTRTDTCQAGTCVGTNPVICTALDQCHVAGTCDPASGTCSTPSKTEGTACNDGNVCTQTDTCQAGTCTGSNPVVCPALDQCHDAGTCNPANGVCSTPAKPNGSACTDGDACTQTDTCQAGACVGTSPVVCPTSDQCHDAGSCNSVTGICSNPSKADGVACDDGLFCTVSDACSAGVCGGTARDCSLFGDQCNDGTCNEAAGQCEPTPKPDGTACSDSDGCTQTDTCTTGLCVGANPVVCAPQDACHKAGVCDSSTGSCSNPSAAPCDDGDLCTTDTCDPTAGCVFQPVSGLAAATCLMISPAFDVCRPIPPAIAAAIAQAQNRLTLAGVTSSFIRARQLYGQASHLLKQAARRAGKLGKARHLSPTCAGALSRNLFDASSRIAQLRQTL